MVACQFQKTLDEGAIFAGPQTDDEGPRVNVRIVDDQWTDVLVWREHRLRNNTDTQPPDHRFAHALATLHFKHRIDGDAGVGGGTIKSRLRCRAGRANDHALAIEIFQLDMIEICKSMILIHNHENAMAAIKYGMNFRINELSTYNPNVALKLSEIFYDILT